jgi:hypothetical protein
MIGFVTSGTGVSQADIDRAYAAAKTVLHAAGVSDTAARDEYRRQWGETVTGDALVWVQARAAADRALTDGWHDPDAAYISEMGAL